MSSTNHRTKKGVIRSDKTVEITSFEGIIPDVETLRGLEELLPGCSREWMDMAKSEVAHRQLQENRITWSFKYGTLIGQILGFLSTISILLIGLYCIYKGYPTQGAVVITGSAASVITAFIVRSVKKD